MAVPLIASFKVSLSSYGPFNEAGILLRCTHNNEPVLYNSHLYLDNVAAICGGRERRGCAKEFATINFQDYENVRVCEVVKEGALLMRISTTFDRIAGETDLLSALPLYNLKVIPRADGPGAAIKQLVSYEGDAVGKWQKFVGSGMVELRSTAKTDLAPLSPKSVGRGFYTIGDYKELHTIGLVPNAGVLPASGNRDVVGPLARCVRDAAICLDVLAGYTSEDPKTLAGVGKKPKGDYSSKLSANALKGKRLALYGSGWRNQSLSMEARRLYDRALGEIEGLGAVLVEDPFAASGFADLRRPTPPFTDWDGRGLESAPYDLHKYLERLGPGATLTTFAEFAKAIDSENLFGRAGLLNYLPNLPQFAAILANPSQPPNISEFIAVKEQYLMIFDEVFARYDLDACVFPQMFQELPPLHGKEPIRATTVDEINIAGLPAVTVPAGCYASGSPFGLIFVGRMWSEAELLAYAYAYESATRHRKIPILDR
ncbi:acetoacetate decarboxylase family protein [Phyllobacterium chamaecytisi]|uniref:acetoacetate decarboxylase family protein n=1 Tax=Phyllobacterium chamaecytisi TaxID=2876082 RepID=UPI001CC9101D|nr:acetoacetate decarboxylase family protein [Phyllobacterium sp. KW56]MBZ9603073.1 acetoacetate decarboxylase family protein [Phyllobacterium sp. KW56]